MKQDVKDLYKQIVDLTLNFLEKEEEINIDDLLSVSSTMVCFAVDLIRNNTDADDLDIQAHLEEAIDVALLPEDELDELANEDDDVITEPVKIDKKLLN